MARKKAHEEHANHEAWAIPYGDLVTLLLALFVVLYSMSAVNEGKFRVLSESLNAAFNGKPRTVKPVEFGEKPLVGKGPAERVTVIPRQSGANLSASSTPGISLAAMPPQVLQAVNIPARPQIQGDGRGAADLKKMADEVDKALGELIKRKMVSVRRSAFWLEIDIRTDILFPSGVAEISAKAQPVLAQLAAILKPFPNQLRVEGHTDNMPIRTAAFPSNWQLSAARAAGVVSLFMQEGIEPQRMSVAGYGEYQPAGANDSAEGRNRNRRVLVVVLGVDDEKVARQLVSDSRNQVDTPVEAENLEAPDQQAERADAGDTVAALSSKLGVVSAP